MLLGRSGFGAYTFVCVCENTPYFVEINLNHLINQVVTFFFCDHERGRRGKVDRLRVS